MPDVVRIGVGQPLTGGPLALFGQDVLNGANMAVDDINAAGLRINGKAVRLEIVAADDHGKADDAGAAAAQLVQQNVVAAIAHLDSGSSIAAAPVYAAAGVPQLAISTNPRYTQLGLPTTLRVIASDDLQSRAMAAHAAEITGATKFAVVDDGSLPGKYLAGGAEKVLGERGKSIVLRRSSEDKRTDFSALVSELAAARPDVLVSTLSDVQIIALMPQLAAAGLSDIQIVGGNRIKTNRLADAQIPVRAVMATSPVVDAKDFDAGAGFITKYINRFKTDAILLAHYSYDLVHLVVDALARNASVDKALLLERLKTFDGNCPVTGSIRFSPSGEQRYGAISVYRLSRKHWDTMYRSDRW